MDTLGALSDALYEIREKKGILNGQLRDLSAEETSIESRLLEEMQRQGTTICRGNYATVSVSKSELPQVIDWEKVYFWVSRHKAPQLFQRRLSVDAYREILESGKTIPGITTYERTTLNVRKV